MEKEESPRVELELAINLQRTATNQGNSISSSASNEIISREGT